MCMRAFPPALDNVPLRPLDSIWKRQTDSQGL
jgi:hypothetical protein